MGTRPATKLAAVVAPQVWHAARELGYAWAEISGGFPAMVRPRRRPAGNGILFGRTPGYGLEVVLDRREIDHWMTVERDGRLEKGWWWRLSDASIRAWSKERSAIETEELALWRLARERGWAFKRSARCMGKEHELFFTGRGFRSQDHSPEELLLLARIGEGCGLLVRKWRSGEELEFKDWGRLLARRRLRNRTYPVSVADRWAAVLVRLMQEELAVSGLPAVARTSWQSRGEIMLLLPNGYRPVGEAGPGNVWFRSIWKRGIRASPGRFPVEAEDGGIVWLVSAGRNRVKAVKES